MSAKVYEQQWPLAVLAPVAYDDFVSGVAEALAEIPGDAIITRGMYIPILAWDSATSAVMDIGDSVDDDEYTATPIDLKTAAAGTPVDFDITGYQSLTVDEIIATVTVVGAPTEGNGLVYFEYVVQGRGNEVRG